MVLQETVGVVLVLRAGALRPDVPALHRHLQHRLHPSKSRSSYMDGCGHKPGEERERELTRCGTHHTHTHHVPPACTRGCPLWSHLKTMLGLSGLCFTGRALTGD